MATDSPQIIRPIPRRPFDLNLTSATPPEEDSSASTPAREQHVNPNLLSASGPTDGESISRAQSIMNLTSSTLSGIYENQEPETPWGTGAQTPLTRLNEERQYGGEGHRHLGLSPKEHSTILRRRMSTLTPPREIPLSTSAKAMSLILRASLLFGLGMGYGILVTHIRDGHSTAPLPSYFKADDFTRPGYDWRYLVAWGAIGVVLGGLLPWLDGVWEDMFGTEEVMVVEKPKPGPGSVAQVGSQENPGTDWALVVRGVGAFVGIAFAIRRLPWASTLQASMTLALVNPFLWYLIDRSIPGFLLSAAVGLTGSGILLGLVPEMMPSPTGLVPSALGNRTQGLYPDALVLGGIASQKTVEAGIWMVSVLFCSCVCFGNIGRRLAWHRSAAGRGRWGGLR